MAALRPVYDNYFHWDNHIHPIYTVVLWHFKNMLLCNRIHVWEYVQCIYRFVFIYTYRNHTNWWSEFLRFQKCRELQAYAKPQQIKGCVVKTTTIIIIINDIIIIISYIIIMSISSSWHHHHGIIINIGYFSRLSCFSYTLNGNTVWSFW